MNEIIFKKGLVVFPLGLDEATVVADNVPSEGKLVFDFQNLQNLNSYGTRLLIRFVRDHAHQELEFHHCPSKLIETINIVQDLLGPDRDSRIVKSFEMPYECEACRKFKSIIVNSSEFDPITKNLNHDVPTCSGCGNLMELEVNKTDYLNFLTTSR